MELGSAQFLKGKTILVTGATGFLGKVFVEKLLRIQSDLKKLYLLLRASDADAATKRLHDEIISKDLFKILRDKWGADFDSFISEKIIAVEGDVSVANLGLEDENNVEKNKISNEIDIIVNVAATTNFDERFDIAIGVNTMGALNVLNFAKTCPKIQALLHVSTAYVCGEAKEDGEVIKEEPFQMGQTLNGVTKLDIEKEKILLEKRLQELEAKNVHGNALKSAMVDYGIERANLYGWPNTYAFTKAMGEMFLSHLKDNIPLIIVRPTIVSSTFKEPFPGWIEGFRTIDSVIGGYGKGIVTYFLGRPKTIVDVVLNLVSKVLCLSFCQDAYRSGHRKVERVIRMAKIYEPYLLFKAVFNDGNTESLRMATKMEKATGGFDFEFDPLSIDWTDYMINVHIPGLIKFVMK
ncbi:probable fatty acyl-CoA reductase 4 [Prosopis cineraria]|uniref:probable fatty acyl-CoA reductase 4 n=1 Tax=Prosopis cineraria TaxID=364024 RepID=UPI00240F5E6E|nr:probable fatty acyl-CoA reductase 4 [Prosopis cineraria]